MMIFSLIRAAKCDASLASKNMLTSLYRYSLFIEMSGRETCIVIMIFSSIHTMKCEIDLENFLLLRVATNKVA